MKHKSLPTIIGFSVAIGIIIGSFLNYNGESNAFSSVSNNEAKIKRLINFIEYEYVDDVDTDSLLDGTIDYMLEKLDPHSVYISREQVDGVNEKMQGNFVGIGVQFSKPVEKDTILVTRVINGGPSQRAGLLAGDRILMANEDTLYSKDLDNESILSILKGDLRSRVTLKVFRKSTKEYLDFDVVRGNVPLKSVSAQFMINDSLGYIKVDLFARTTYREFKSALYQLKEEGMQALVLDLRDNLGGFLDIAEDMVDEFLEEDKLIVFTKNKSGKIEKTFATEKGGFEDGEVYVLINENSASASEIVAGALQDNDKGVIVGRRSFGKGLVQQEMALGDGSVVRLTTARYYTPTGRSIQKPYKNGDVAGYDEDIEQRYFNGELLSRDSIRVNDSLRFVTPKGKVVYGGGGIVPDVFVPVDTLSSGLTSKIYRQINDFSFEFIDTNRQEFESLDFYEFSDKYVKDGVYDIFMQKNKEYLKLSLSQKQEIRLYLKAYLANNVLSESGFYRVVLNEDNVIQKVLEMENNSLVDE